MMDKGMIHVLGGMNPDGSIFYHAVLFLWRWSLASNLVALLAPAIPASTVGVANLEHASRIAPDQGAGLFPERPPC